MTKEKAIEILKKHGDFAIAILEMNGSTFRMDWPRPGSPNSRLFASRLVSYDGGISQQYVRLDGEDPLLDSDQWEVTVQETVRNVFK